MKVLLCDRATYQNYANMQGKAYGEFKPVYFEGTPVVYDHEVKGEKYIDVDPSDSKYFKRYKPSSKVLDSFSDLLKGGLFNNASR